MDKSIDYDLQDVGGGGMMVSRGIIDEAIWCVSKNTNNNSCQLLLYLCMANGGYTNKS
jgi:hypothetical protein